MASCRNSALRLPSRSGSEQASGSCRSSTRKTSMASLSDEIGTRSADERSVCPPPEDVVRTRDPGRLAALDHLVFLECGDAALTRRPTALAAGGPLADDGTLLKRKRWTDMFEE